jgi:transcriptional regulator with XRE-family HTH domain
MITGPQIRAARLLLGWSQARLARESGVSGSSIHRIENGVTDSQDNTLAQIGVTLLDAGVEFIGSVSVHLRAEKRISTVVNPDDGLAPAGVIEAVDCKSHV